jgi:putative proteasome-type protease
MSDTRTNAGVDNISKFRKMFTWEIPGERVITVLTAGNLATSQAVISLLDERTKAPHERRPSVLEAPTMFQIANIIGDTLKEVIKTQKMTGPESEADFGATIIVGGQINGMSSRLFLIYPEGNFIEASEETPFFQVGETKYGRPILLRAYDREMSFEEAVKLLYVSFDSTLKANLSVGMPLDLQVVEEDGLRVTHRQRVDENDPYFHTISRSWGDALKLAFQSLPDFCFEDDPA